MICWYAPSSPKVNSLWLWIHPNGVIKNSLMVSTHRQSLFTGDLGMISQIFFLQLVWCHIFHILTPSHTYTNQHTLFKQKINLGGLLKSTLLSSWHGVVLHWYCIIKVWNLQEIGFWWYPKVMFNTLDIQPKSISLVIL